MIWQLSVGEWVAVAAPVLAGVVWAVRLEGRVNATDRELAAQEKAHQAEFRQVRDDLQYIRGRLDRALDGRQDAS